MKNWHPHQSEHIYPGEYTPLPLKEKELAAVLAKNGLRVLKPGFSVKEMPDHYAIELFAPGFTRQDFSVHTNGYSLSVSAMRKKTIKNEAEIYLHHHESECDCLKLVIPMRSNIDTDFVTAEYKNGILSIMLAKTSQPAGHRAGEIIVY